jgi:hypothetical protein
MSTTMPSGSSAAAELDVDDEGRAVQTLRRPEHLTASCAQS